MKPKKLSFEDQSLVTAYFKAHPPHFSEMTFSNLIAWSKSRPIYYIKQNDKLLFLIQKKEEWVGFGPHAEVPKELNYLTRAQAVTDQEWECTPLPEHADYLLRVEDLIQLEGHSYHRLRQKIRSCYQRYTPLYSPILEQDLPDLRQWIESISIEDPNERSAIHTLLSYYTALQLEGGVIRIQGQIKAMMIGEPLNPETFVGHVEKSDVNYHGLTESMYHTFAKNALSGFTYFNIEQDLGIPGLKTLKERLKPDQMIIKYDARRITSTQ